MDLVDLQESRVFCPYCGESIEVLLNPEELGCEYIEDCQVCCRPIEFTIIEIDVGRMAAKVRSDAE